MSKTNRLPLTQLQRLMAQYPGPWHVSLIIERLLARNLKSLEYDPHVQYRFHQTFMFIWICCIGGVWFLSAFHEMAPRLIMEVSLYANFATDFGAMSSALAAGNYHCAGCRCDNDRAEASVAVTSPVPLPPAEF